MPRVKGTPKTGGRKKGTPNKVTTDARKAMELAFNGVGGVDRLISWGKANLTEFFRLWGRLVPNEQKMEHSADSAFAELLREARTRAERQ